MLRMKYWQSSWEQSRKLPSAISEGFGSIVVWELDLLVEELPCAQSAFEYLRLSVVESFLLKRSGKSWHAEIRLRLVCQSSRVIGLVDIGLK